MLKVDTEPLDNCEVMMTVEVDEQQSKQLFKSAARRISKQVKIPGFRPGKAPYHIIAQRFGEDAIRGEVLEDLSRSVFKQALEQAELEPSAPASMEDVSWDPLVMKVRVPVEPVVELGDYRAMRMDTPPVEVEQEEIEEALEDLREEYAVWNPVERAAKIGDLVTMAIRETVGEEVLSDDDNFEYELLDPEEEEAESDLTPFLIGMSPGEEKEFVYTYPEDDPDPDYAGKEVETWVSIHSVKEKQLYPLDDDFAQTVGDFDTLDQLKQNLADELRQQKQREADFELGEEALNQLVENAERVEWPLALEEEEVDSALEERDEDLKRTGMDLDTYLSVKKQTREEYREKLRPSVQERLRRSLVLGKLIELEKISISSQEVSDRVNLLSRLGGEPGDRVYELLSTPKYLSLIANNLVISKVKERLAQIVKGEAPELEEVEETEENSP